MNQRIECTLETIVKNCPLRLHIPVELTYPDVLEVLDALKVKVAEMFELAKKLEAERSQKMADKAEVKS